MTDRELLVLAAKAAGIEALRDPNNVLRYCTGSHPSMNIFAAKPWNPLYDDGDALRLAVRLQIDICHGDLEVSAECYFKFDAAAAEPKKSDPYAATRRAIVRAAAEIGRAMP